MKYPIRILALLVLLAAPVIQASQDGHKLYESCVLAQVKQDGVANRDFDADDYYAVGYCDGMVQGVSQSMLNQKRFCLPKDTRFPQLTKLVADYLTDHPKQRSLSASQATYNALLSRYPCLVEGKAP